MARVVSQLTCISLCLAAGACTLSQPELPTYAGELQVYLEPYDERNYCRLHVALRNVSGTRQGFSEFLISWEVDGAELADTALRHNAMRDGMLRSASTNLPVKCSQVERMRIESAVWELFEGWDRPGAQKVLIAGADATDWRFDFDQELGTWVGSPAGR